MTTTTNRTASLARDARDLATHARALVRHVETAVDPIAALPARTAVLALEELAELLEDPDLEPRR